MKQRTLCKSLAVAVIILFIGIGIQPAIANNDDTTPPVTVHTLDPSEPDGLNGWYVSDVTVTLTATDDNSGVKEIRYTVNGGIEHVISGDNGSFILDEDGWRILIQYWAIDNADNVEYKNELELDIDQTVPEIQLSYESKYLSYCGWALVFTATACDDMSGMEYVEYYDDDVFLEAVYGAGPDYDYIWDLCPFFNVIGFIRNPVITFESVTFYSRFVLTFDRGFNYFYLVNVKGYDEAGNSNIDYILSSKPPRIPPGILLFQNITLPYNYQGFIGDNFIFATFNIN